MFFYGEFKMDFFGLILELIIFFGIPLFIPLFIILCIGNFVYNKKIKKIILFILSIIYNGIVGFIGFLLSFCLVALFTDILSAKIIYLIILVVFLLILVPINIFIIKKSELNAILYIILNIIIFVLGFSFYVILMRKIIEL